MSLSLPRLLGHFPAPSAAFRSSNVTTLAHSLKTRSFFHQAFPARTAFQNAGKLMNGSGIMILPNGIANRAFFSSASARQLSQSSERSGIFQFFAGRIPRATHRDHYARTNSLSRRAGTKSSWRRKLDNLPESYILWGIAGLNVVVFLKWYVANVQLQADRNAGPLISMYQNFVVNWKNVSEGRVWTILTSCFSHNDFSHILFNGLSYYFMAPAVIAMLGNSAFLALYLGSGIVSSTASLLYHGKRHPGSQGASGAIYSVVSFFACVHPTATFLIFGIVPCPAWAFVGGIFAYDMYRSIVHSRTQTDTAGHVGGMLSGIAYFLWRTRFRG